MQEYSAMIQKARRIVVKVGTSTLTYSSGRLNIKRLEKLVRELANLYNSGKEIILVTSGAVGAGAGRLGLPDKPLSLPQRQAAAAVGQGLLMETYAKFFMEYGVTVGQILLTRDDMGDRQRYLNIRNTMLMLVNEYKTIPIINENDTVATDELRLRFGDNDTLSALVAALVGADLLILLSDIPCLYSGDPKSGKKVEPITVVRELTPEIMAAAGEAGTSRGTGGMITKLEAARIAMHSGIIMLLVSGEEPEIIDEIINGRGLENTLGTIFLPGNGRLHQRERWIAFAGQPQGEIRIDQGAVTALVNRKKSLLPSGIIAVHGSFGPGDLVRILAPDGTEVARGLTNFSAEEVRRIMGEKTTSISEILGSKSYDEVVHRNNLVCDCK
ncbi:MAG TPA: glutamate 5-kinase [Bacillota bacterium]